MTITSNIKKKKKKKTKHDLFSLPVVFSNKLILMEKRKAAGKCICEDIDKIKVQIFTTRVRKYTDIIVCWDVEF